MLQAGALVQVYTDGTVLLTHGGVEMGQGLHTKIAQIAASCFNIPLNSVFISETSTDKVNIALICQRYHAKYSVHSIFNLLRKEHINVIF